MPYKDSNSDSHLFETATHLHCGWGDFWDKMLLVIPGAPYDPGTGREEICEALDEHCCKERCRKEGLEGCWGLWARSRFDSKGREKLPPNTGLFHFPWEAGWQICSRPPDDRDQKWQRRWQWWQPGLRQSCGVRDPWQTGNFVESARFGQRCTWMWMRGKKGQKVMNDIVMIVFTVAFL